MSWKSVISSLAVFFLLAGAGFAQDLKSEVNVEGIAGITQSTSNFILPYSATIGGGFLAGYRYHMSPLFALEGDYGFMRNTQNLFDPLNIGGLGVQTNVQELTGAAVLGPSGNHRIRPYVLAGGGALFFRPTNNALNSLFGIGNNFGVSVNQTRPAFLYGGGIDIGLTKFMALRAEYRGFVFKAPGLDIAGLSNIPVVGSLTSSSFTHMAQPAVGLVWRF
jgi:opacity protein-like surface antigen